MKANRVIESIRSKFVALQGQDCPQRVSGQWSDDERAILFSSHIFKLYCWHSER